jgi:diguanylate cyclase (GGDEF)-like protein/PAS domain S-box-containing protein
MKDQSKTKKVLIQELVSLRQRIAELEHSESDRRQAEEALRESEARLCDLNELQGLLLLPNSIEQKLKLVTETIVRIMGADFARIWMIKPGDRCQAGCIHAQIEEGPHTCRFRDRCLHLMASSGRYTHTDGRDHSRVPFGCYKIGKIAAGEESRFLINEVTNDQRVHNHTWAKELGLVSFAGYRLADTTGIPNGVLALFSEQAITAEDDLLLQGIAYATSQVLQAAQAEEALRESEERHRTLVENANDIVFTTDNIGYFTFVNPAGIRIVGYEKEEIIGRHYPTLIRQDMREDAIRSFGIQFVKGLENTYSEYPVITKEGSEIWLGQNTKLIVKDGHVEGFQATARDITELKRAEEEERRNREEAERMAGEMAVIAEIGRVIGSTLEINEVYDRFAEAARKLIPFDRVRVNLINPDGKSFTNAYVSGLDVPDRRPGSIVPLAGSVSEILMQKQSGRIIHVENTEDLVRQFPGVTVSVVVRAGIRSLLGVPLIYGNEVIGVLHFRSKKTNAYTERDLRLAERIGTQIAGAIANAQLFSDRKRMEEEIRDMSLRDQMTELYNRRGFITLAEQQIRAANRAKRSMLLTFIDCDGLKGINDTLGHEEGDRALIDTANVLRQTFRESDVIARLGGDEFAVLSIDAADMNPEDFPKRLQQNIDAGNTKEARPYKLAMSWGMAVYDPGSPLSLDELMSSADERMYAQKKTKPNRRI